MARLSRNPLAYAVVMAVAIGVGLMIGRALSGGSLRPDGPMLVTIGLGGVAAFVLGVVRNRRAAHSPENSLDS